MKRNVTMMMCEMCMGMMSMCMFLRAQNDRERLRLLNAQRHIILTEIHEREHALSTLDVLRHQLHIAQNC